MNTPKAVVFDLGKVLLDFDYGIAVRRIAGLCPSPASAVRALIEQSPLLHLYESGQLGSQEFYDRIREASGFQGDFNQFASLFGDIFTEITPMVRFHQRLHQAWVPTYILSNTNDLAIRHIRAAFPFFNSFNGFVLSYEQRCMKPDARIYQSAENLAGFRGQDLLYFDDRPENVEGALALGWQAILHQEPDASLEAARGLGLPVD